MAIGNELDPSVRPSVPLVRPIHSDGRALHTVFYRPPSPSACYYCIKLLKLAWRLLLFLLLNLPPHPQRPECVPCRAVPTARDIIIKLKNRTEENELCDVPVTNKRQLMCPCRDLGTDSDRTMGRRRRRHLRAFGQLLQPPPLAAETLEDARIGTNRHFGL